MKDKSKEHVGLLKSRILVSHFRHPTSHYGSLASRCLSEVCASVSGDPSCLEIWEMNNCRQLFQEAWSAASADSMAWQGLELDFVDMYHQIPTPSVIPAISYFLHYLQSRRAAGRPYTNFAISKVQRSDDRFGTGASASFKNVSIALVLDFISYEMFQCLFARVGSLIVQQVGGLPMGGPLSAQSRLSVPDFMRGQKHPHQSVLIQNTCETLSSKLIPVWEQGPYQLVCEHTDHLPAAVVQHAVTV